MTATPPFVVDVVVLQAHGKAAPAYVACGRAYVSGTSYAELGLSAVVIGEKRRRSASLIGKMSKRGHLKERSVRHGHSLSRMEAKLRPPHTELS